MRFAQLKNIMWLDRLRLRGPNGEKGEFILAATVQKLRKIAKLRPMGLVMDKINADGTRRSNQDASYDQFINTIDPY